MGVTIDETHQQVGDFAIDIDNTPTLRAEVLDEYKRPRKVHVLIYDENDTLIYVGVLLRVLPTASGLTIGGSGLLWHLGQGAIGPYITDREYVSGANKLSNGNFALGDLLWQPPAEESNWIINVGSAWNAGGFDGDDVLVNDERHPTAPGKQYRAALTTVYGTGRMRVRIIFDGNFNPPNLWTNGDLFTGSTGWSGGTYVGIVADHINAYAGPNVMRCLPIPKPQLIADPNFETGGGWTDVLAPPPQSDDIDIVSDPANAYSGSGVMRVGPVTQHQVFTNADFGQGGTYWYASSTDAEPHAVFGTWPGDGVNGSDGIITTGYATAGRPGPEKIKYLRADSVNGGGVDTYTVPQGTYRAECYAAGAPGTEGSVYISIMLPGATPPDDFWYLSNRLYAPPNDDWRWKLLTIENIPITEDRTQVNGLIEVHDHGLGHWKFDQFTMTRTQGNRARIESATTYTVDVDTTYELAALLRAGDNLQSGFVKVGATLQGAGLEDQTIGEERGSTDSKWDRVAATVVPTEGYTDLKLFVAAQDIVGDPAYVDYITLTKMDNNRDSISGPTITVTPERTYRVTCKFRSGAGYQRGDARMSFRCMRAGYPDVIQESSPIGDTEGEWVESSFDVVPPSGYGTVETKVIFTDIEGDVYYASHFTFTDTDKSTVVFDGFADSPTGTSPYVDAAAPDGSQFVRVASVVEQGTSGWILLGMSLARIGVPIATIPAIVADLLNDPDTGEPLSLTAGSIASGTLPYDWTVQNMTNRDALTHLVDVVADPPLEFKVNADRTLDVGEAADIFTDHRDIVLLPADLDVKDLSDSESNVEERATVIRVFGADRETVSGRPYQIRADSVVPGVPERDWNDRVITRVKSVHDGTIDHQGYAQAFAADLAAKEAEPALSLTAVLSGVNTRPAFDVGDWLYAYKPESGLSDETNPMPIEGDTVFPRRVRVLGRSRQLGPTHRIVLRHNDGTTFDLPMLETDWAKEDSTTLTIGDREVDWVSDPQGGVDAMRYLKDRQSRPR